MSPAVLNWAESETQKLDKLAKVLVERPGLNLEITGLADPKNDRVALAKEKLNHTLTQRKMKTLREKNPALVENIPLGEREYERMVQLAYAESMKLGGLSPNAAESGLSMSLEEASEKPEKKSGFWEFFSRLNPFKSSRQEKKESSLDMVLDSSGASSPQRPGGLAVPSLDEMERRLIEKQQVTPDDMNMLRQERAKSVQGYLLKAGQLGEDRLFIAAPEPADGKPSGESQVTLALK